MIEKQKISLLSVEQLDCYKKYDCILREHQHLINASILSDFGFSFFLVRLLGRN